MFVVECLWFLGILFVLFIVDAVSGWVFSFGRWLVVSVVNLWFGFVGFGSFVFELY